MAEVIVITGAVTYPITLDPSVWIFDDRKFELQSYREEEDDIETEFRKYLKGTGAQWDKELREGATPPEERRSLVEERKALEGDYAMKLAPFLERAEPHQGATYIRIHRENGETIQLPFEDAKKAILQFSKDGKPIRDGGPVLFYLPEDLLQNKPPLAGIYKLEVIE